jgi:hypothetical protein
MHEVQHADKIKIGAHNRIISVFVAHDFEVITLRS